MAIISIMTDFWGNELTNNNSKKIGDWATIGMLKKELKNYGYKLDMTGITTTGENTEVDNELLVNHPVVTIYKEGNESDFNSFEVISDDGTVLTFIATWKNNEDGSFSKGNMINLKVGDYVEYNPIVGAPADKTTISLDSRLFDANNYVEANYKWRVLDVKNGKVRLISEECFGPYNESSYNKIGNLWLNAKEVYINVDDLNKICGIFGYGYGADGAKSIVFEDVLKNTGINPNIPKYRLGQWDEYGNTVTYERYGNGHRCSSASNGLSNPKKNVGSSLGEWHSKFFDGTEFVDLSSTATVTSTAFEKNFFEEIEKPEVLKDDNTLNTTYELLFGKYRCNSSTGEKTYLGEREYDYILASRFEKTYNDRIGYGMFRMYDMKLRTGLEYSVYDMYGPVKVRPIVSLKEDVQLELDRENSKWIIK